MKIKDQFIFSLTPPWVIPQKNLIQKVMENIFSDMNATYAFVMKLKQINIFLFLFFFLGISFYLSLFFFFFFGPFSFNMKTDGSSGLYISIDIHEKEI